jgi:hypothetical protein
MILKRITREKFTIIATKALEDPKLSWKAKGLLAYIMSRPSDWRVYVDQLSTVSIDKKHSTKEAVKELMNCGYVTRKRITDEKGRVVQWEYTISDFPQVENPLVESPPMDFPQVENQPLLIKDYKNNEIEQEEPNNIITHTQASENFFSTQESNVLTVFNLNNDYFQSICNQIIENLDTQYYHKKINHYTQSKSIQKTQAEWEAYVKMWIEEDIAKNKVKLLKKSKNKQTPSPHTEAHEVVAQFARRIDDYQTAESIESVLSKLRSLWTHLDESQRATATQIAEVLQNRVPVEV